MRLLLLEGDVDGAWREAEAGRCEDALWMTLAAEREKEHPADAVPIYQREVEVLLRRANNDAYASAVRLLEKIRAVMARMDAEPAFRRYLAEVRAAHARKPNFMRRLDASALGRPA